MKVARNNTWDSGANQIMLRTALCLKLDRVTDRPWIHCMYFLINLTKLTLKQGQ